MAGQCVSNNVQLSLPVHYGNGQFIHTFQPSGLATTQILLSPNIHPWLMISINCSRYSIAVIPPFNTRLVYGQQLFLSPTIVAFRRHVLAAMVSKWLQTIIILLEQYSTSSIIIRIHVYDKRQFKIWRLKGRQISQKFTELGKHAILISTTSSRSLRAGKISKGSGNISIMMYILCIVTCQA